MSPAAAPPGKGVAGVPMVRHEGSQQKETGRTSHGQETGGHRVQEEESCQQAPQGGAGDVGPREKPHPAAHRAFLPQGFGHDPGIEPPGGKARHRRQEKPRLPAVEPAGGEPHRAGNHQVREDPRQAEVDPQGNAPAPSGEAAAVQEGPPASPRR